QAGTAAGAALFLRSLVAPLGVDLGRRLVVAHALLETLDRLAEIAADVAQPLRAEDHQHDHQDDDQFPPADTHVSVLVEYCAILPRGRSARLLRHRAFLELVAEGDRGLVARAGAAFEDLAGGVAGAVHARVG